MTNPAENRSPCETGAGSALAFSRLVKAVTSTPALVSLAICVATLGVYLRTAGFDFLNYDDPDYVTENPHVLKGLTRHSIWWALTATHAFNWHPITWLSHMLDVELFGTSPTGPHLVNVLLHTANALLVFVLVWRLTGRIWPSAFVAAFFALHPLRVESVAWVSERKDVLSVFFGLLTLLFYALFAMAKSAEPPLGRRPSPHPVGNKKARLYYALALICFALGLMSKPMLVTWPFLMLLLDYWPLKRLDTNATTTAEPFRKLVAEKLPFFALSLVSSLVTFVVQKQGAAVQSWIPFWARLENAFVSYARYLGKIFWPFNLAVPYPHPGKWPGPVVLWAIAMVLILSMVAWLLRRSRPHVFVGWFWFVGTLVPVIGLVQVGLQAMADRYTYFPSIGLYVALCWLGAELATASLFLQRAMVTLAVGVTIGLAIRTTDQLAHWQNTQTLFTHTIRCTKDNADAFTALGNYNLKLGKLDDALHWYEQALLVLPGLRQFGSNVAALFLEPAPTNTAFLKFKHKLRSSPSMAAACAQMFNNYGFALAKKGRPDDAMLWYRAALDVKPGYVFAMHNLGVELANQNKHAEAIELFNAVLRRSPAQAETYLALAKSLKAINQPALAIPHFRRALVAFKNDPAVHEQLGVCLAQIGATTDAIKHYKAALELDPRLFKTRNNLGAALLSLGEIDAAIQQLRIALELNPDYATAHENLGIALAARGDPQAAESQLREAIRLDPGVAATHFNLGNVLAQQGKLEAAVGAFRDAIRLEPNHVPALCNLAGVLTQLGQTNDAIQLLQKAIELAPDFAPAKQLLESLKQPEP